MQFLAGLRSFSGLRLAGSLTLIAVASWGCAGSGGESREESSPTAVTVSRLERPELVVWRSGHRLVSARANGQSLRVLVGSRRTRALKGALFQRAAWSPNRRKLAFAAQPRGRLSWDTDVYLVRADGSGLRRLTSDGRSSHPVWSHDPQRIYFAREGAPAEYGNQGRTGRPTAIWSMRPDGSDRRPITPLVKGRYDIPGSVSPDGATVAFTRGRYVDPNETGRENNTNEIWLVRPDGAGARKVAERSQDPAFSPDGRRIAFSSDRDENGNLSYGDRAFYANELYVMNVDGSGLRRLTRTRSLNERQPSWLPNGKRLAYQRGQTYQNAEAMLVMQMNSDGTCPRTVFPDPGPDRWPWYAAPTWRPGDARSGDGRLGC